MPSKAGYGGQAKDANQQVIRTGSGIETSDATTVPQDSPLAYGANGNQFTIQIPTNAAEIVLRPSTDLRIGETTGLATYFVIPAGITLALGVAKTAQLFADADVGGGTLNFYFVTV